MLAVFEERSAALTVGSEPREAGVRAPTTGSAAVFQQLGGDVAQARDGAEDAAIGSAQRTERAVKDATHAPTRAVEPPAQDRDGLAMH
jgi:hypothetical protein